MTTRKEFLIKSGLLVAGTVLMPSFTTAPKKAVRNLGVQLYTFRNEMAADAVGTLEKIAALGIKQIESARSEKGLYYGLGPKEMKKVCKSLGMTLRSGHVALDKNWQNTLDQASESGQEYLICSSMPSNGQTVDNYKAVAEAFNKAGEDCKQRGIKFGYHNHDYEFESENGEVLYDVLLDNTQADLVHMELDLGWVVVAGKDPLDYFKRYTGRFPLWHLKDMDMEKKESTEFGRGGLNIPQMLKHRKESGLEYIFIEQEEYASTPFESMAHNMEYMKDL
ncbi:Inosose dehydratase [Arenibacter antarcticus]|uniref:Sugar phosphate isomerase/epimerase family protein n=1 Tax=Arenibacter antarcticus TaxID=2040469 RepID=A0ABW5VCP9_9FLAO|nr:sugar phosphate isomerase/epimerase [Arenibacter sp. H213]MCM4168558.1 sugar phosphate isomerase/epimerase [Arenibacter sp. H213]